MASILTTRLDPVDGLVDYTLFTKPYHTKILEVIIEYVYTDCLRVTFEEDFWLSVGQPDFTLLDLWGWTEDQAKRYFNCDWEVFNITAFNMSEGYYDIDGDKEDIFNAGDKILVRSDEFVFHEFTVSEVETISSDLIVSASQCEDIGSPAPDCQTIEPANCQWTAGAPYDQPPREGRVVTCGDLIRSSGTHIITRIYVEEELTEYPNRGVIYPAECWAYSEKLASYSFKAGLVWPSHANVLTKGNCGGYGYQWENLLASGEDILNPILSVSTSLNYFEIRNDVNVPPSVNSWQDIFQYGLKFSVTNSVENNGVYRVLNSQLVYEGSSPPTPVSPEILRIYTTGNISSGIVDGDIQVEAWGYDEPTVCVDEGHALRAQTHLAEDMQIVLNENGAGIVYGWDMQHWDVAGFDGGSFTYTLAHT